MAGHSSDATSPADHLLRTTEMEAVVLDLRKKVEDLKAPESPELTEVNEAIDRLFKIVLYEASEVIGRWGVNPRVETIFDSNRARSLYSAVFWSATGAWTEYLTASSSSVMSLTFGNETNIAQWLDDNAKDLATTIFGSTDMLSAMYGNSLAEVVFGTAEILDKLNSKSLVEAAIGTAAMIDAISPSTALEMVFGDVTRAATWSGSPLSVAEAIYGDDLPLITDDPAIQRIAALESRMNDVEARLSLGGF